jgi:hypothetical protein
LARRFIEGFRAVGALEQTGVFDAIEDAPQPVPKQDILAQGAWQRALLQQEPVQENVEFIWKSAMKEFEGMVAAQPCTEQEMDAALGTHRWAAVPSFCITQASGKQRRIDDAKRGGHNSATVYSETGRMCTAFQPGVVARLVAEAVGDGGEGVVRMLGGLETGGEDMPNAFRNIPVHPGDHDVNIIAVRHPSTHVWHYQLVWAALFGYSSAVISFGRWSVFLQAVCRRLAQLLYSMYVDDGILVDGRCARGAGQALVHAVFEAVGAPLAEEKRTAMASQGTFLGVDHDLSGISENRVSFWVKAELEEKITGFFMVAPGEGHHDSGRGFQAQGQLGLRHAGHVGQSGPSSSRATQAAAIPRPCPMAV